MKLFMGAYPFLFLVDYMRLILLFFFLVGLVLTSFGVRFIKVANETMCRPIRALTEARGHAMSKHVYVYFISLILVPDKINETINYFVFQTCEFRWSRWSTRMRNCQHSGHKNHFNPSIQFHSLSIWISSC